MLNKFEGAVPEVYTNLLLFQRSVTRVNCLSRHYNLIDRKPLLYRFGEILVIWYISLKLDVVFTSVLCILSVMNLGISLLFLISMLRTRH